MVRVRYTKPDPRDPKNEKRGIWGVIGALIGAGIFFILGVVF